MVEAFKTTLNTNTAQSLHYAIIWEIHTAIPVIIWCLHKTIIKNEELEVKGQTDSTLPIVLGIFLLKS